MTDLRNAAKQALEEWRTEPGSVRMASLMIALQRALAEDSMKTVKFSAHQPWCSSLSLNLMMAFNKPAPCDCKTEEPDLATVGEVGVWGEPVAMRWDFDGYGYRYIDSGSGSNWQTRVKDAEPLYDRPQRREWVTLTQQEWLEAAQLAERGNYLVAFQRILQKLKEKKQ